MPSNRLSLIIVVAFFAVVPLLSAQEKKQELINAVPAKNHVLAEGEFATCASQSRS